MLDLDLEVATASVRLGQQWVGTRSVVEEVDGARPGLVLVVCMAETLRHRAGGPGASLDEEDGAGGKNG